MKPRKKLNQKRIRRAHRTKSVINGTAARPRLAVHRSNRFFYAQLIDDVKGHTLIAIASSGKGKKSEDAFAAGESLGAKAKEKGIKTAVFDRRSYKFHGRVKAFADGAKKAGLKI